MAARGAGTAAASIAVNKAHYPVTVLGPGRRIGIWLQGCSIHCPGCISQDTWAADDSRRMSVADLLAWCRRVGRAGTDGITISGGEPFDQPAALAALLNGLHRWRSRSAADFDILCYSGYPLARLRQRHAAILALLDAVIPEPYVDAQPPTHVWRGSANQPLVALTPRGEARYRSWQDVPAADGRQMQIAADGQRLWLIGIPQRGDMPALEALCRERGLTLAQVSWR
jgi:anaerobic ribonucleoside-triphosphate reductase activating protein